jgi:hypothetical protein
MLATVAVLSLSCFTNRRRGTAAPDHTAVIQTRQSPRRSLSVTANRARSATRQTRAEAHSEIATVVLAGVVRRHRKKIGSCWRSLNPERQALLVLVHLRNGESFAALGAGFGVGTATAWRYVHQAVALLAARAPKLDTALGAATRAGQAFVVIDGTLIPIDRVAADRPFYSGKHRKHGMNLQVIASPQGEILWVSGALPGAVHDLTAARIWGHRAPPGRRRVNRARRQGLHRCW